MKILRLWGIPIHKILSDTEYVEKTRKGLRLSKKLVWIHVAVLALLSLFIPWLIDVVQFAIDQMPDGAEKWVLMGLMLGLVFGALLWYYIAAAAQAIVTAFDPFDSARGTRLLIKYHDMLQEVGALEGEIPLQNDRIMP